jgi:hypothetical protein
MRGIFQKMKNYFFFLAGAFLTAFLGAAFFATTFFLAGAFLAATFLAGAFFTTFLGAAFFAATFFFGAAFLGAAFFFATGIEKKIKKIEKRTKKIVYIYIFLALINTFPKIIFVRKNNTTNNKYYFQKTSQMLYRRAKLMVVKK